MIILFVIFVSKELPFRLYGAIFQFDVEKSTEDAEDADVSDMWTRTTASCQKPCLHAMVL